MTDENPKPKDQTEKQFHGWRLLGVVIVVLVLLAAISAAINVQVLGLQHRLARPPTGGKARRFFRGLPRRQRRR